MAEATLEELRISNLERAWGLIDDPNIPLASKVSALQLLITNGVDISYLDFSCAGIYRNSATAESRRCQGGVGTLSYNLSRLALLAERAQQLGIENARELDEAASGNSYTTNALQVYNDFLANPRFNVRAISTHPGRFDASRSISNLSLGQPDVTEIRGANFSGHVFLGLDISGILCISCDFSESSVFSGDMNAVELTGSSFERSTLYVRGLEGLRLHGVSVSSTVFVGDAFDTIMMGGAWFWDDQPPFFTAEPEEMTFDDLDLSFRRETALSLGMSECDSHMRDEILEHGRITSLDGTRVCRFFWPSSALETLLRDRRS